MNPIRKETKRLSKLVKEYKGGMGLNTKIDGKHSYHFYKRFVDENAKVLKEAQEEMARIRQKKINIFLGRRKDYMAKNIPQATKDEYHRRNQFIKQINEKNK